MSEWKMVFYEPPPIGIPVRIKISDESGDRNEAILIFDKNLWWLIDRSMYVYYTPTHWMYLPERPTIILNQREQIII